MSFLNCDTGYFSCHKHLGQIWLMQTPIEHAAEAIAMHNVKLRCLLLRMIDPEDLGHAVSEEVRHLISDALVRPRTHDE